ncbi:polysaccharide biosynthesis tyrosine autokinase [Megalodesulfovibrio paquesii]
MVLAGSLPNSCSNEEYKKAMEVVLKATAANPRGSMVLVTSARPREGKSVTSINLAINLARQYDHTVLLVDCDLRRPVCHEYLGLAATAGLSECLQGKATIADSLIKTGIGKLTLFPAGNPVHNPVELISSRYMRDLLLEMKNRYADRYIIMDTPPILLYAETRFLLSLSDISLLVVREGETSLQEASDAANLMGDKLLGVVYNGAVNPPLNDDSYYGHYAAQNV